MSDTVISVEKLSKRYIIGHQSAQRDRYTALRDVIGREARNFIRKAVDLFHGKQIVQGDEVEEFWALRNVSFGIKQGEVVGIIGRNGAGKSTLLKILSRITEPTEGRVRLHGRVGSLLEVGTGFHPELTGRENIFLNGAILGMGRKEIARKFDEIIAFAEVEQFLDAPVKHYSSGMYVRLAFAVAAHLEPDILLVDEVLAVGDAAFQKKCLGQMKNLASVGRTVLFVSHQLSSIEALCTRCLLIGSGRIVDQGAPTAVIHNYILTTSERSCSDTINFPVPAQPATRPYLISIEMLDARGEAKAVVHTWDDLTLRIKFFSPVRIPRGSVVISIKSIEGRPVSLLSTQPDQNFPMSFEGGESTIECVISKLPLAAGDYQFGAALAVPNDEWLDNRLESHVITIHPKRIYHDSPAPTTSRGIVALDYVWRVPHDGRKRLATTKWQSTS